MKQETVTLTPGPSGKIMVSDLLPVIIEANDVLHSQFSSCEWLHESPEKYVRDFRTIRLSIGMRMGHTFAVRKLAKPGDLVVDMSDHMALDTCSNTAAGVECISRKTLLEPGAVFKIYPTIWLLNFDFWPRTSMKDIRSRLIKSVHQRMIILQ